jgi:spore coat protein U-like protein
MNTQKTARGVLSAAAIAASLMMAGRVQAASSATPMDVSAVVAPDCRITVSNLAFGSYDPLAQNAAQELNAAADVSMLCTKNSRASIIISGGRNGVGSSRSLSGGTQQVSYQLYRDADRTQTWGSEEALQYVSAGISKPQQMRVYGRIPPGQEVASGVYTDVVTAAVDF